MISKKTIDNIRKIIDHEGRCCGKYLVAPFHKHLVLISKGVGKNQSIVAIPKYLFKHQVEDYDSDWFDSMKEQALMYYYRKVKVATGRETPADKPWDFVWENVIDKHVRAQGY